MKLSEYLKIHNLSYAEFGRMISKDRVQARRYALEEVNPREQETINKITEVTNGAVTANDFYGAEANDQ